MSGSEKQQESAQEEEWAGNSRSSNKREEQALSAPPDNSRVAGRFELGGDAGAGVRDAAVHLIWAAEPGLARVHRQLCTRGRRPGERTRSVASARGAAENGGGGSHPAGLEGDAGRGALGVDVVTHELDAVLDQLLRRRAAGGAGVRCGWKRGGESHREAGRATERRGARWSEGGGGERRGWRARRPSAEWPPPASACPGGSRCCPSQSLRAAEHAAAISRRACAAGALVLRSCCVRFY